MMARASIASLLCIAFAAGMISAGNSRDTSTGKNSARPLNTITRLPKMRPQYSYFWR